MSHLNAGSNQSWRISFASLPTTLEALRSLPEAALQEPHNTAALLIPALCIWTENRDEAIRMVDFLRGPQPLSPYERQFISQRLSGNEYVPYSFFEGARPENGYEPPRPYTVTIYTTPASFTESGYAQLWLRSGGADSPRPVKLRQKPSAGKWFLTDQMLLAQIRKPDSQDPWA